MSGRDFFGVLVFISLVLLASCDRGQDTSESIPIESFIFKSEKSSFKLSPDGKMIAYLGLHDHCKNIFILDLEDESKSKQLTYQADLNVQNFQWVNNKTIVFSNTQSSQDSLRILTVSVDDERVTRVIEPTKSRMRFLRPFEAIDGAMYALMNTRDSTVFDLYRVFLDGRTPVLVYQNPGNIVTWIPSHDGVVRMALASDSAQESVLYRSSEAEQFSEVVTHDFKTIFQPMGFVDTSSTRIYALSNENRDKLAIVEYDVWRGKELRQIFVDNGVDVNFEGYYHDTNALLFASTNFKEKSYSFFDNRVEAVYKKLDARFSPLQIDFVDIDIARKNYIIKVYSDTHPEHIYHYDAVGDRVMSLSELFPALSETELQPMEAVSYSARDNRVINGFITYPKGQRKDCPVVVLVHDGPTGRDEWGFQPDVQFLANRGYAVFQVNYRGSRGYGKDFWAAGFKEWGGRIQSDITDGVTWLIHQGIANKDRIAIMGSGFGGYSALHAACFNPSIYRCAISSSGYSNLFTFFREIPPIHKQYVQMYYQIVGNPERETDLFRAISPVFHADKVRSPVLYFQGGKDRYSSVTDANQFVAKLKQNNVPVRYIFKENEGKRFRTEENMVLYYQEIEQFLGQNLK